MSAEMRKRAAAGALVHSGPSEKRATTAVYGGRAPKVEPHEDVSTQKFTNLYSRKFCRKMGSRGTMACLQMSP